MNKHHHDISPERIAALHAIRDRFPGVEAEAQRQRLLCAMQTLQSVSTFEASRHLDVYYPPARKLELLRQGHPIQTIMRYVFTEAARWHMVGVYFLERGTA